MIKESLLMLRPGSTRAARPLEIEQETRRLPLTRQRLGNIRLRVIDGPERGKELTLESDDGQAVRGGRSPVNEVVLADDLVSGVHFELAVEPSAGVVVRDLGSTNGVFIGAARIKEAWLGLGGTFTVGQTVIELVSTETVAVAVSARERFGEVWGASLVMRELFAKLERLARIERLPVLLNGETGTGKELVARALHDHSSRSKQVFVTVNCAAIPAQLAESYLFGHRKGSFTGATDDRRGLFEEASGGTFFLDEIGELPLELQPKLLRALQEGEVQRIGDARARKVDVRVISATHRDLRRMVAEGSFREDLYFRLAATRVGLPPLRERGDDILTLAERFLARLAVQTGVRRALASAAREALRVHRWPGNVRELGNVIERAYFMAEADPIGPEELSLDPWSPRAEGLGLGAQLFESPLKDAREEFERIYLRRLLAAPGTLASKAKRAGLSDEGLRQARRRLMRSDDGDEQR